MPQIAITRRRGLRFAFVLSGLLALLVSQSAFAKILVLTAPPRENAQAGQTLYGPLATGLSKLWGVDVHYQHPSNWLQYQRAMREGKYDIVFDGPHFADWRMVHLGDRATIKLTGALEFYLVAHAKDASVTSLDDLIGKHICGIAPPNLATMSVITQYRNPSRQPVINGIRGGFGKVYKAFTSGRCDAAVFRSSFYNKKLTDAQRATTKIIFKSRPLPNQVITMSKRVTPAEVDQFMQWYKVPAGQQALAGILKRFGGKKARFVAASAKDYEGDNMLLEGVVFGW